MYSNIANNQPWVVDTPSDSLARSHGSACWDSRDFPIPKLQYAAEVASFWSNLGLLLPGKLNEPPPEHRVHQCMGYEYNLRAWGLYELHEKIRYSILVILHNTYSTVQCLQENMVKYKDRGKAHYRLVIRRLQ